MSEVSFQLLWVSLICSLILVVVSFHPPVVFVSIILVVIFSGCLCSLFAMLNRFFVMMVVMSSSPVSMYSASIGVDCGTMSILRIIFSCIWLIFLCSFFVVFIVSPLDVLISDVGRDTISRITCITKVMHLCNVLHEVGWLQTSWDSNGF